MKFLKVTSAKFFLMFLTLCSYAFCFSSSQELPQAFGRLVTKKESESAVKKLSEVVQIKKNNEKFVEKVDPVYELILKINNCERFRKNDMFSYFRAINNEAKNITTLNVTELENILISVNELFKNFFLRPESLANKISFEEEIEVSILDMFISSANEFKTNPSKIIADVSKKTAQQVSAMTQEEINILEKTRSTLVRFVELQIDKLEWDSDLEKVIDSFLEIANQIFLLAKNNVIDDNDVFCDLIKSLIARLDFFLKQNQNALDLSFFESFKAVLDMNEADFFLQVEEADEVSQNNKAYLLETLSKHYKIFVQRQDEKAANLIAA